MTEEKKSEETGGGPAPGETMENGPEASGPKSAKTPEKGPATAPPAAEKPAAREDAGGPADQEDTVSVPHPYEEILDDYPLRDASEDPVWSIRIVKGWMWFLAVCGGGIILLTILGFFFD